jgi:nitrogen-specific signal transduction histidine kinase
MRKLLADLNRIRLGTAPTPEMMEDAGPGIPDEIRDRLFEPSVPAVERHAMAD